MCATINYVSNLKSKTMINRREWLRNSAAMFGSLMFSLPEIDGRDINPLLFVGDKMPVKN